MADTPTPPPLSSASEPNSSELDGPTQSASVQAGKQHQPGGDAYMASYLAAVDLTSLELDDIEDAQAGSGDRLWHGAGWLGLAALVALATWLPTTSFFVLNPWGEALLWLALAGALGLALWLIPASLAWFTAVPGSLPELSALRQDSAWALPTLSPQAKARALLAAAVGLGLLLMFILPHEAQWTGRGFTAGWFAAVFAAIAAGILVGRFLMASAEARPKRAPGPPLVWPSWMRWVNLAVLVAMAVGLIIAGANSQGPGNTREFPLAGLGLVVGIGAAIWLASRFDELERNAKQTETTPKPPSEHPTEQDSIEGLDATQLDVDSDLL